MPNPLDEYANELARLPETLEKFLVSASNAPRPGSPLALATVEVRDRPTALALLTAARNDARDAAEACGLDVVAAARLITDPPNYYSAGIMCRASMEAAGLVRWLMVPTSPALDLLARYVGRARDEQDRGLSFLKTANVSGPESQAELGRIRGNIIEMKTKTLAAIEELALKPVLKGPTALAELVGEGSEYNIFTGATHTRRAILAETKTMMASPEKAMVLHMHAIAVAARAYFIAVETLFEAHTGTRIPELDAIADSLGLNGAALDYNS